MVISLQPNNWFQSLHCRLFHGFEAAVNFLELRADSTIDACEQRQHAQARQQHPDWVNMLGLNCLQRS